MIDIRNPINTEWSDKRITILGAGKSGIAAAELAKYLGAVVFISDSRSDKALLDIVDGYDHELGGHSKRVLDCELLIISPGISDRIQIVQDARDQDIPIVSEIEFASWFTISPILAITGSNGKTTTTHLLHQILRTAGLQVLLGGNIGIPFASNVLLELKKSSRERVHVLELSSFQLEHIYNFCPTIAALLNVSPDHLNRYDGMDDYINAKLNILGRKHSPDWIVYNGSDTLLMNKLSLSDQYIPFSSNRKDKRQLYFIRNNMFVDSDGKQLLCTDDIRLKGSHNLENILAAATMANLFGVSDADIFSTVKQFKAIPHRLEFVKEINGTQYYNDSKATNINAAIAAILSFEKDIILILGGMDKGASNFRELLDSMESHVTTVIAHGDAGMAIREQLMDSYPVEYFWDFASCVNRAYELAYPGSTVLLAPACASFDQFVNYEERGEIFKNLVNSFQEAA